MSSYADGGRIDPQEKDRGLFQVLGITGKEVPEPQRTNGMVNPYV